MNNMEWLDYWRREHSRISHRRELKSKTRGLMKQKALRGQAFALMREEREQYGPA